MMLVKMLCYVKSFQNFLINFSAEISSKMELHDKATGHHLHNAVHPRRLVGRGGRGVPVTHGDALPRCQLHR